MTEQINSQTLSVKVSPKAQLMLEIKRMAETDSAITRIGMAMDLLQYIDLLKIEHKDL